MEWIVASCAACGLLLLYSGNVYAGQVPDGKIPVRSQEDLPRYTYSFDGELVPLITGEASLHELTTALRDHYTSVLDEYAIEDAATLKDYHGALLNIALLDEDYERAMVHVERLRELAEKPADKLTTGLWVESAIAARQADGEDVAEVFAAEYAERINPLPWDIVQDTIESAKASWETLSENLIIGFVQEQFQPAVDKTGTISGDVADALIGMRVAIVYRVPIKAAGASVLRAYIEANRVEKPNIWTARAAALDAAETLEPVTIAILDSGVDTALFGGQLFANEGASEAERHGIAWDLESERTTGLLLPLTEDQAANYDQSAALMKGMLDLQAAIDSDEATMVKERIASLEPQDVRGFVEEIGLFGNYAHGTHVAGIAAEGNPGARVMAVRITFDYRMIPIVPTIERAERQAASARETVAYLQENGVRVVNMSWGSTPRGIEGALEANGVGESAEERKAMAREMFDIGKAGLTEAIQSAPEILFVAAAGNSDSDAAFDEAIPSSIESPNLIAVGAVDQAGDETSFTSYGPNVVLHGNGFEVDSYIPGGQRLKFSGTSMAAPQVANLAGKLFALCPELSVADAIAIMRETATDTEDGRRHLMHPAAAIEAVRVQCSERTATAQATQ